MSSDPTDLLGYRPPKGYRPPEVSTTVTESFAAQWKKDPTKFAAGNAFKRGSTKEDTKDATKEDATKEGSNKEDSGKANTIKKASTKKEPAAHASTAKNTTTQAPSTKLAPSSNLKKPICTASPLRVAHPNTTGVPIPLLEYLARHYGKAPKVPPPHVSRLNSSSFFNLDFEQYLTNYPHLQRVQFSFSTGSTLDPASNFPKEVIEQWEKLPLGVRKLIRSKMDARSHALMRDCEELVNICNEDGGAGGSERFKRTLERCKKDLEELRDAEKAKVFFAEVEGEAKEWCRQENERIKERKRMRKEGKMAEVKVKCEEKKLHENKTLREEKMERKEKIKCEEKRKGKEKEKKKKKVSFFEGTAWLDMLDAEVRPTK